MNERILSRACWALGIVSALILTLGTPVAAQEEAQTPSTKMTPPGTRLVIHRTVGEVQTDSAQIADEVDPVVDELIAAGVPPGAIVLVAKFAIRSGLTYEQTLEALEMLGALVGGGLPPGLAANMVKESIDGQAQANAEAGAEAQSAGVAAKGKPNNPGKGDDPPGQKNKQDKDESPPEPQGASDGNDKPGKPDDTPGAGNGSDNPGKGNDNNAGGNGNGKDKNKDKGKGGK